MIGRPFQVDSIGLAMLWVAPGTFWMGSSKTLGEPGFDPEAYDEELPARRVTLTPGYWVAEHPITNARYAAYMEATKAKAPALWRDPRFNAPAQPVVGVDWEEARAFCGWLTRSSSIGPSWWFDVPTEAEWEYAARGEEGRKFPWGTEAPDTERADFGQDWEKGRPGPIGAHPSGASRSTGAQEMAGSVWEWCRDAWQDNFANMMTRTDNPVFDGLRGAPRVVRGGSWSVNPWFLRCAARLGGAPGRRSRGLGFRVVCRGSRQHVDN